MMDNTNISATQQMGTLSFVLNEEDMMQDVPNWNATAN